MVKKSEFTDKGKKIATIFSEKRIYKIIVVLFLIALTLLIYSNIAEKTQTTQTTTKEELHTEQEIKLATMLENIPGVEKAEVMITQEKETVSGVLVFFEGENDPIVQIKIRQAVQTALPVNREKIRIYNKQSQ